VALRIGDDLGSATINLGDEGPFEIETKEPTLGTARDEQRCGVTSVADRPVNEGAVWPREEPHDLFLEDRRVPHPLFR
jgi:hypothetical protein